MISQTSLADFLCLRSLWSRIALLVWVIVITDTVFRSSIIRSPTEIVAQYVINIGIGRKLGEKLKKFIIFNLKGQCNKIFQCFGSGFRGLLDPDSVSESRGLKKDHKCEII